MQDQNPGFAELVGFLRRRALPMVIVSALVALVTLPLVFALPPVYRSTAKILVEDQDIPRDLVRSTITSFAEERIQVISQRLMTIGTLLPMVEKYDLYARERRYVSTEEILDRMRNDIRIETVSTERGGGQAAATIAFKLSYSNAAPDKAQKVASELVSLYLNENVRARTQRAGETTEFLSEEAARVGKDISELEAKLATFKRENAGRLPELLQFNMQLRDRAESELDEIVRRIQMLEDRKIYLASQLTVLRESTPAPAAGDLTLDPEERLRALRNRYASAASIYSATHPDVVRMRREIDALEKSTGSKGQEVDAERLEEARNELKRLSGRYAANHPDVVRQRKLVASLEAAQSGAKSPSSKKSSTGSYISLAVQIESATQEVQALRARHTEVRNRLAAYNANLRDTPGVEQIYRDLVRDYENATRKYNELRSKQMEARIALTLEKDRKAERFSLIEPPQYPEKPAEPNRKKLLAMAVIGSVGGGVGAGVLAESLNHSVTGPRALGALLDVPVMGVVPRVTNEMQRARRRRWLLIAAAGLVLALIAALIVTHFFIMPLDTLGYVLLRRLQL
jgi:uncharacterized protein involved in exopolysaccharide biosynthesis